jgi:hypothetical protein
MADMTRGTSRTGVARADTADTVEYRLPVERPAQGDTIETGRPRGPADGDTIETGRPRRRLSTETKSAFKTTEFWIYLAAVAAVLIVPRVVGAGTHHVGYFRADRALLYIVILTVGYMLSRGFAKSGSRQPYDE